MPKNNQRLKSQFRYVLYIFIALSVIEIINLLTGRVINQYSIVPRSLPSLPYIFTAPFLHANLQHFLSNIFTLCIFCFLLLQFGGKRFIVVSISLIIGTGILVWLFGRTAYHLGASGIIYGYFGYLVLAGLFSKKLMLLLISILVAFFYGAMVWGVLPSQPYVSWESHLFGFTTGITLAWYLAKTK